MAKRGGFAGMPGNMSNLMKQAQIAMHRQMEDRIIILHRAEEPVHANLRR